MKINQQQRVMIMSAMAVAATFEISVRVAKGQKFKNPWLTGLVSAIGVASVLYQTNEIINVNNALAENKK